MQTADEGPPNAGVFRNPRFRNCPELDAPDGGNGRTAALRCFANDGSGQLVAGLYPSDVADQDDHWAHGEPLTTEADAALARERAHQHGRHTTNPVGALLGIALDRLRRGPRRYASVRIPASLTPWRVSAQVATADGHETTLAVDIDADTLENAKTVAAATILTQALGGATARPLPGRRATEDAAAPRQENQDATGG